MNKIEQIKAEIERLNSLVSYESKDRHDEGLHDAYKAVKNIIASLPKEQPSEDLEKAVEESWFYYEYRDAQHLYSSCYKDGFRAGAQWDREQMMKDAVEGEVHHFATVHYINTNDEQLATRLKDFGQDTKVKIIIVKEDEK